MIDHPHSPPKLVLLDIDGVLTDGKKFYDRDGNVKGKAYCDLDFTALKCFKACHIEVALISGDRNINEAMAKSRGLDYVFARRNGEMICKSEFLPALLAKYGCTAEQTVFCGDDIFDIEIMRRVGWSFCPANSPSAVRQVAKHVLCGKSGEYLVMEMLDYFVSKALLIFPSAASVMAIEHQTETVRYDTASSNGAP